MHYMPGREAVAWWKQARCRGMDIELFFPTDDDGRDLHTVPPTAARVCDRCKVRSECLTWALDNPQVGVWGGTTRAQRDAILRRIRRAACPTCGSGRLVTVARAQTCTACGTSWIATVTPAAGRRRGNPWAGSRRRYPPGLRDRAVAMVLGAGGNPPRSIASVAGQLGVNRESLRQWVAVARNRTA